MNKILPIAAAVACGLFALVDFFVPDPLIDSVGAVLVEGVTILAAFGLILGVANLMAVHARRVYTRVSERSQSVVLVVASLATLAIGLLWPGSKGVAWVFQHIYYPLQASMAALLAFFIVSAFYRAFRLRNAQAFVLLVVSLFVFLAQLPFSGALSPYLPIIREWLFAVPVTAGVRGIILGSALGTIATSLRVLLAVDQLYC